MKISILRLKVVFWFYFPCSVNSILAMVGNRATFMFTLVLQILDLICIYQEYVYECIINKE